MAKVKIDINHGVFEAEGDERFIQELFSQYLNRKASVIQPKAKESESFKKETYSLVKEVNLSMDRLTLKQFYVDKRPGIALERNSVFVYYLEKIAQLERITVGHIYTCYKELGVKPPAKLKQSLADTASKKGWLDTSSMNNIKITLKGESYVEHELPKS